MRLESTQYVPETMHFTFPCFIFPTQLAGFPILERISDGFIHALSTYLPREREIPRKHG